MQCGGSTKMKKMQTGGEKKLSKLNQTGYLVPTGKSKTFKTAEEKKAAVQKMLKGSSKTTTKMQMGGAMGIVGMPKYSNDPRTDAGRTLKKGGSTKSTGCPPGYRDINGECVKAGILDGKSARIGVGTALTGMMGIGAKAIADKVRAKKAAKKAKETPKAKFGASVKVQHSPAPGRVRSSSGVGTVPVGMRKKKGGAVKKYQDGGMLDLAARGARYLVKKAVKGPTNNVNYAVADGINRGAIKSKGLESKITKAKKEGIVKGYNPTMSKAIGKGDGPNSKPQPTGQYTPAKKAVKVAGVTSTKSSLPAQGASKPQPKGQPTSQSKIKAMKSTGSKPMLKPIASGVAIANGPKPKPIKKAKKGGMVKGKKSC
jgi:hypothetical protein